MMMNRVGSTRRWGSRFALFSTVALLAFTTRLALADEATDSTPAGSSRSLALGVQIDFLPTILSASAGEFGGAGQLWFGWDHVRLRYIGARVVVPEAIHGQEEFSSLDTTVLAMVADYTFGARFDKWWVSTGFELWFHDVSIDAAPEMSRDWRSVVWTVGGGYIWRFSGNFYLDPWIAVHVPLSNRSVDVGDATFDSFPVQPEASLKLGYYFDI